MPMYNLIEYNKNYSKTTGRLWNYYRDEPNSGAVGDINYSYLLVRKKKNAGRLEGNNAEKEAEIVVP